MHCAWEVPKVACMTVCAFVIRCLCYCNNNKSDLQQFTCIVNYYSQCNERTHHCRSAHLLRCLMWIPKRCTSKKNSATLPFSQTVKQVVLWQQNYMQIVLMRYVVIHRKTPVLKQQLGPIKGQLHHMFHTRVINLHKVSPQNDHHH